MRNTLRKAIAILLILCALFPNGCTRKNAPEAPRGKIYLYGEKHADPKSKDVSCRTDSMAKQLAARYGDALYTENLYDEEE